MTRKQFFIVAAVLLALAVAAGVWFFQNQQGAPDKQAAMQRLPALTRANTPMFGNADAPVHIVEFVDPACGTCREFYPFIKSLMAAHPGKIRVSMRYAPFHQGSDQVVKALAAARLQGQFQQTLETLFANQEVWVHNHTANVDQTWPLLERLGLDMTRLRADMVSPEIANIITQDLSDANTMGVTMTPEFFVNGKPLPSFGYDELKKLVDDAVANVK